MKAASFTGIARALLLATACIHCGANGQSQVLLEGASARSLSEIDHINTQLGVTQIRELDNGTPGKVLNVPQNRIQEWSQRMGALKSTNNDAFSVTTLRGDYRSLFHAAAGTQDLTPSQETALQSLRKRVGAGNVSIVSLAPPPLVNMALNRGFSTRDGFDQPGSLSITLEPGKNIVFSQERATAGSEGLVWEGSATVNGKKDEQAGEALLLTRGNQINGTVRSGSDVYSIIPLGSGLHAVAKNPVPNVIQEHPPRFQRQLNDSSTSDAPLPDPIKEGESVTVDVLVGFSKNVGGELLDRPGFAALAVTQLNKSFVDSGVRGLTVRLVGAVDIPYTEESQWNRHLDRMANKNDSAFKLLHKKREEVKADVMVVMISDKSYCGEGRKISADADTAFAVVHHGCATLHSYYSFSHELGHLLGARHDRKTDPVTTPFQWAHGYVNSPKWRTVMAYNVCNCPRILRWSNPKVMYEQEPTGNIDFEHDARVWMEYSKRASRFR